MTRVKFVQFDSRIFFPQLLVERKTWDDFLSSLMDNRLSNQIGKKASLVQKQGGRYVLILEGGGLHDAACSPWLRQRRRQIYGKWVNMVLRDRIAVLCTRSCRETYQLLVVLAENKDVFFEPPKVNLLEDHYRTTSTTSKKT